MYINKDSVLDEYERLKSLISERKSGLNIFIYKLEKETSCLNLLLHYADYWTAHMYEYENRRKEML